MTDVIVKPAFIPSQADSGDTTKLGPNAWTAPRLFSDGSLGDLLYRDTGSATGASWLPDVAVGSVLVSGGVGAAPAWSTTIPNITFQAGTDALPSIAFTGVPGTGLSLRGADGIGFASQGTVRMHITGNSLIPAYAGAITVGNSSSTFVGVYSDNYFMSSYFEGSEIADPAAPAANKGRLYFRDTGGKTELVARFPTGAIQQVAIEP